MGIKKTVSKFYFYVKNVQLKWKNNTFAKIYVSNGEKEKTTTYFYNYYYYFLIFELNLSDI